MNKWLCTGFVIAGLGIVVILLALFSDYILLGTRPGFGPGQVLLLMLGSVMAVIGIDITRQLSSGINPKDFIFHSLPRYGFSICGLLSICYMFLLFFLCYAETL